MEQKERKMAHWIIDDHGFGGTYYTCSECGEVFIDIFEDVCGEDKCPHCGSVINDEENEYYKNGRKETESENKKCSLNKCIQSMNLLRETEYLKRIRDVEEKLHKLEYLSGYKLDRLIELFAAGYTLQTPPYLDVKELENVIALYYAKQNDNNRKE
jgi:hypothetical protein